MGHFNGCCSIASRQKLRPGGSLLFTTKFPKVAGAELGLNCLQ